MKEFSSSSADSSFDYEKQVLVYLPQRLPSRHQENWFQKALRRLISLLTLAKGRALVLTTAPSDVQKIRRGLKDYRPGFWEGIDVPGEALTLLVIWQLPFPPKDPLIEADKTANISPLKCVKYPWEVKILPDKDRRVKEEEENKECNTDVDKNNLAFAAMDIMLKKDSKQSKPRQ